MKIHSNHKSRGFSGDCVFFGTGPIKLFFKYIFFTLFCLILLVSAGAQSTGVSEIHTRDMVILGSEENVHIQDNRKAFRARIDTGAQTSSIHAGNIHFFERDGERWVRFDINHDGLERVLETPLESMVAIRQANSSEPLYRPLVMLNVQLGPIRKETLFTLADRSRMTFPVLIGRNFLWGDALVDVSKSYLHGK